MKQEYTHSIQRQWNGSSTLGQILSSDELLLIDQFLGSMFSFKIVIGWRHFFSTHF